MPYISSDTNIWIDFAQINRLEMPFGLENTYCMSRDAIDDELISPPGVGERLLRLGLRSLEMDEAEFTLVIDYGSRYPRLSFYDRLALAIAKNRDYILLSGDSALRKAAAKEQVSVRGTLWIFDQLLETGKITKIEYLEAMKDLLEDPTGRIRLPKEEIRQRMTME